MLFFPEFGAEKVKGDFAVLSLASFLLAFYDYSGGFVGKPYGCIDFIDVLPAGAAAAEKIPLKALLAYCCFVGRDFRQYGNCCR